MDDLVISDENYIFEYEDKSKPNIIIPKEKMNWHLIEWICLEPNEYNSNNEMPLNKLCKVKCWEYLLGGKVRLISK